MCVIIYIWCEVERVHSYRESRTVWEDPPIIGMTLSSIGQLHVTTVSSVAVKNALAAAGIRVVGAGGCGGNYREPRKGRVEVSAVTISRRGFGLVSSGTHV